MRGNAGRDTRPEMAIRRRLHAAGLRYRVCARVVPGSRLSVDIAFRPERVAVEVRGCFWHRCPEHFRPSIKNSEFWNNKIAENVKRDSRKQAELTVAGWTLITVWEHEDPDVASDRVIDALQKAGRVI